MIREPLRGGWLAGTRPHEIGQIYLRSGTKRSAAEWALRWIWNHPEVTVVLSGMNDENHLAENLTTCEDALPGSMTADELATIAAVAETYIRILRVGCTGCGYCTPCPSGVRIQQCFSLYNNYHMGRNRMAIRARYGLELMDATGITRGDAALCTNCGRCMKVCPQQIAIPEELRKVSDTLGGSMTRIMLPPLRLMYHAVQGARRTESGELSRSGHQLE